MTEYTEEIKRIKACAHSAGLRIEKLKQQNAELLEALKTLKDSIDWAKFECKAAYVVTTEDYKMIEQLLNKYTHENKIP